MTLIIFPDFFSINIKYPSIETVKIKFSTIIGVIYELTFVSQLKLPEFISIEKIWFLLLEKITSLPSVTKFEFFNEKAAS